MAPVPAASDRSGRRFPDRVVVVLGPDERVCDLVKNRFPNLINRCFEAKETGQADHPGAVIAASGLSGSVVELKTPPPEAVSMDESIREPGHLCELLIVSPSGIGRNRFKQCVRHPIVLAVITSNYGALGAEPGDDTAKRAGLIRERNLVVGAEARLERVVAEVHRLFLTRLVPVPEVATGPCIRFRPPLPPVRAGPSSAQCAPGSFCRGAGSGQGRRGRTQWTSACYQPLGTESSR